MTSLSLRLFRVRPAGLRAVTLLLFAAAIPALAGAATVTVDENNLDWGFVSENAEVGFRAFNAGPAGAPLGQGSLHFAVDGNARELIGTQIYNGTRFDAIDALSYSTYRFGPETGVLAISLQFNVDYDLTDGDTTTWQGRLVFEPYQDGSMVDPDVWQTWDALAGAWWASGSPGNTVCTQGSPCTWAEVLAAFPDAGVQADASLGAVILKAGGPWSDFYGAVDALTIDISGAATTFDFEPSTLLFADGFESADILAWDTSEGASGTP